MAQTHNDRAHTDESLKQERERADRVIEDQLAAADETSDAIIARARKRADALLAASRQTADQATPGTRPSELLKHSRALEDSLLERERVHADLVLSEERVEHMAMLTNERESTDDDLAHERTLADHAVATRDEFLGIVSHDLRNMLGVIVTVAGLLETEATVAADPAHAPAFAHARRLRRSAARMERLVGDLIDVASIEAGMLALAPTVGEPADIVAEAVETFQAQAAANGIALVIEASPPPPQVMCDSARVLQVLCNLLSNAIKFTPAGGVVTVRVAREGGDIVFAISDTGKGIPDGQLEVVFDRFVQLTKADRRGVGLGLFISKCIVESHGGRIWAEQRGGGGAGSGTGGGTGSTFSFTLPV